MERTSIAFLIGVAALLATACSGRVVTAEEMGQPVDVRQDRKVAEREVTCKPAKPGCHSEHLRKGEACYRLARQEAEAKKYYVCAATHLQMGVSQARDWTGLDRAQVYERLAESLWEWQIREEGREAERVVKRLWETARAFTIAEPQSVAAVYFLASAQLARAREAFLHPPPTPKKLTQKQIRTRTTQTPCQQIKEIEGWLKNALPRTLGTRHEAPYQKLNAEVMEAKRVIPNCSS